MTTTDAGQFEAVISTATVDREKDIVEPDAMVDALRAWTGTGKRIPLHWNHSSDPEDIVGHIDPASVEAVNGEVVALGWVDQDTDRGRHVWRLAKSQTLGFSFGYLVVEATKRVGGGRHITRLDVFEVSATATPMNNGTRVLSTKAVEDDSDRTPTEAELERQLIDAGIITNPASAEQYANADPAAFGTSTNGHESKSIFTETDPDTIRTRWREDTLALHRTAETKASSASRQRSRLRASSAEGVRSHSGSPRRPGLLLLAIAGQRFVPRPVLDAALKILHRRRRSPTGMANDPYDLANASTPTASCRRPAGRC